MIGYTARRATPAFIALVCILSGCSSDTDTVQDVDEQPDAVEDASVADVTNDSKLGVDDSAPPPNTLYVLDWSVTWNTSDGLPTLEADATPSLLPLAGPAGDDVEVTVRATSSGGQKAVGVVVRVEDSDRPIASLDITRKSPDEQLVCGDQLDGQWTAASVRSFDGCSYTNEAGIFFARWVNGSDLYLFQSTLGEESALPFLESWEPV